LRFDAHYTYMPSVTSMYMSPGDTDQTFDLLGGGIYIECKYDSGLEAHMFSGNFLVWDWDGLTVEDLNGAFLLKVYLDAYEPERTVTMKIGTFTDVHGNETILLKYSSKGYYQAFCHAADVKKESHGVTYTVDFDNAFSISDGAEVYRIDVDSHAPKGVFEDSVDIDLNSLNQTSALVGSILKKVHLDKLRFPLISFTQVTKNYLSYDGVITSSSYIGVGEGWVSNNYLKKDSNNPLFGKDANVTLRNAQYRTQSYGALSVGLTLGGVYTSVKSLDGDGKWVEDDSFGQVFIRPSIGFNGKIYLGTYAVVTLYVNVYAGISGTVVLGLNPVPGSGYSIELTLDLGLTGSIVVASVTFGGRVTLGYAHNV
nr:hypothetical protein [archaeon]